MRVTTSDLRGNLVDLQERQHRGKVTISRAWIDEMTEATNLPDVCEGVYGVVLEERTGDLDFRCPCPLPGHIDKSPSFFINSTKGIFVCFGCGQKGGLLKFLQVMEGLSFREAVFRLSEITGIGQGGDESQIMRAMRDIRDAADDFLGAGDDDSLLPGGMGIVPFLTAMAVRMREYEAKVTHDQEELVWVDSVYRRLDKALENQNGPDEKTMARLWRGLSKEIGERLAIWRSKNGQNGRTDYTEITE